MAGRGRFAAITIMGLLAAAVCSARTITVALDGSGEYTTIQAGIDASTHGDTVIVADGIYTGVGNRNIEFKGRVITVKSANGPGACVVNCGGSDTGFLFQSNEGLSCVLDGFTIINAYSAAVCCDDAGPTIRNCLIRNNQWDGISLEGERQAVIEYCTIVDNQGDGVRRSNAVFGDELIIRYSEIRRNSTGIDSNGAIRVRFTSITSNRNSGIRTDWADKDYIIVGCYICNNGSHGIYAGGCSGVISQCEIAGNAGGGVRMTGRSLNPSKVYNSILRENTATRGGAIYAGELGWSGMQVYVVNCLVIGNSATYGGGVYAGDSMKVDVYNSIFWNNTAPSGSAAYVQTNYGELTVAYCDVQGGRDAIVVSGGGGLDWGDGNIDEEPLFAFSEDFHLLQGSPCIDAGTNVPTGGLPSADWDSNTRVLDGDGDGDARVDMGPYEFSVDRACIALSSTAAELFAEWDSSTPAEAAILLRNAGGVALNWQALEDCDWLEVVPVAGNCASAVQELQLRANPSGLAHGSYSCTFEVMDEQAVNSPREVAVAFHVHSTIRVPEDANSIQVAIDMAVDGDTVLVADGVYTGKNNRNISLRGKAITLKSENGPEHCILDGENKYNLFYIESAEGTSSVIDGFTIANGYRDHGYAAFAIGLQGALTIQNCVIENCTCGQDPRFQGPAIFCQGGTRLINCTIRNNQNGGIVCRGTHIERCVVANNTGRGISVFSGGGRGTIIDCIVTGNNGGINVNQAGLSAPDIVIDRCEIIGNRLPEDVGIKEGAGVLCSSYNEGPEIRITNSLITGNVGATYGGGLCVWGYTCFVDGCTIADNRSTTSGGGLSFVGTSRGVISNSIICDNIAGMGRQIAVGIPGSQEQGKVTVKYSAVNVAPAEISVAGGGKLLFEDGIIKDDPLIRANGCWDPNDIWVAGDYRLQNSSRCIDGGDPTEAYEGSKDIDGNSRIIGKRSDIGAHEFVYFGDIAPDGQFSLADLAVISRQWLLTNCEGPDWCRGADLDHDGVVDKNDLVRFVDYWLAGILPIPSHAPVAYWKFDEASGLDAVDASGNHAAVLVNMDDSNRVLGRFGGALLFNGTNECVEAPDFKGIIGSHARSISAWIQTTQGGEVISWGKMGQPGARWRFLVQPDGLLCLQAGGGAIVSVTRVNDGRWHHVAAVLDGLLTDNVYFYVDGEPAGVSSVSVQVVETVAGQNIRIGGSEASPVFFKGSIDEVRLYERALSTAEVRVLAAIRQEPVGNWKFDESGGTEITDSSGMNHNGVLVNVGEGAWVAGKVGGGLELDGVDDSVRIVGWKGVGGGRSRTCCAWIRTTDTAGQIVSWGAIGVPGGRWVFGTEGEGRLLLQAGAGAITGSTVICDGQWHHVAAVLDNDGSPNVNEIKLYVDGVEDTPSAAGDVGINTETDAAAGGPDVRIGVWLAAPQYFGGTVDEVRIYERALDAAEVMRLATE